MLSTERIRIYENAPAKYLDKATLYKIIDSVSQFREWV
jgi:hypothetical protein